MKVMRICLVMLAAVIGSRAAIAGDRIVLPTSVTPEHYRLAITPDAESLTFRGVVEIDIAVHVPTREIVLNGADLVIDRVALTGVPVAPQVRYEESDETLHFTVPTELAAGAHTLSIQYHGKIFQQASGLFALDYKTPSGSARALFTQFENSDARRFVPCWDEPGLKATFDLTATVPANQMALSNMPIASSESLPGHLKRVHFAVTPKMSTYLLFFGVGDFERAHRDVGGVDVGVVVKRGDLASAAFALDTAAQILPYYNDYFGTAFPLPKLDLIAGPGSSQFFGAMENWGAIFYFEKDLLVDPRVSTERDRQNVYIVVAHEMAHQWFGDLVTMAWWDDIWLNEGFASWMENKVTDHFHPEWKIWLQSLREKQYAMAEDAREGTHPIITPIDDVFQASNAFDTITYTKGAAVIRTLESYLGEAPFRDGVRRYMHDHAYANTVTDDLWAELDRGSSRPITQIAHDFTLQAGVPMITVRSGSCASGKTELRLEQGHFAIDAASTTARIWHVPVRVAVPGGAEVAKVVSGSTPTTLSIDGCGVAIVNAGQTAYFRSRYSDAQLSRVIQSYADLSADDQLGVLNDSSALALAGEVPMQALLDLTARFPIDADPVVATALVSWLEQLDHVYDGLATQAAFRAYARRVLNPIFARVGWQPEAGEADNVALLRPDLIMALGEFDDPAVLSEARQRWAAYRVKPDSMAVDIRSAVLQVVAVHADQATWDELHAMARVASTELERRELYDLLASPRNDALVGRALALAMSGEPPPTTMPQMIRSVSRRHPVTAFDFAVAHWDAVSALIEPASRPRYVPDLVSDSSDLALTGKLDAFGAKHIPASARGDLMKAEANMHYLGDIRQGRLPEVDQWLGAHGR
jgi:aminopeptidase N